MPSKDIEEKREFKKRSHRPWKPNLLAKTIGLRTGTEDSAKDQDTVRIDYDKPDYEVIVKHSSHITDNQQIIDSENTTIDTSIPTYGYGAESAAVSAQSSAASTEAYRVSQYVAPDAAVGDKSLKHTIARRFDPSGAYINPNADAEGQSAQQSQAFSAPIDFSKPGPNLATGAGHSPTNYSPASYYTPTSYVPESSAKPNFDDFRFSASDFTSSSFNRILPEISTVDPAPRSNYTFDEFNSYLQTELKDKQEQKDTLLKEASSSGKNSSMSIGGFFQPNYVPAPEDPAQGNKISRIMDDLKLRETEISSLTNDLKISQAMERAEQADLARKMEEQAKFSAEKRMKQAIEQANSAAKQFQLAMEKVQQAEYAQSEEERQKKIVLAQLAELSEQAKNTSINLKAEQQARVAADEKAQHALNQTVQTELSRQELEKAKQELELQIQGVLEELRKTEVARKAEEAARMEAEHKVQSIFQEKVKLEQAYKEEKTSMQRAFYEEKMKIENVLQSTSKNNSEVLDKIAQMEQQLQEADFKVKQAEEQMQVILEQKNKLQSIVGTEKDLRAMADRRAKEAMAQAAQAEIARQAEERQRKLVDERAKRAVAHASKTVMHFLNAPLDDAFENQLSEINR